MLIRTFFCLTFFLTVSQLAKAQTPDWNSSNAIPVEKANVLIKQTIDISVDVAGTIKKLDPAERGALVKAQQIVIEIDNEKSKAELNRLELDVESAGIAIKLQGKERELAELELQDKLDANERRPGLITESEIRRLRLTVAQAVAKYEKSEADKKAAQAEVAVKKAELAGYSRKAEFSGIVTDLHNRAVGASVRPGEPIMTIVNYDQMLVSMEVDPKYEDQIFVGDTVLVRKSRDSNRTSSPQRKPVENNDDQDANRKRFGFGTSKNSPIESRLQKPQLILTSTAALADDDVIFIGKVTMTVGKRTTQEKRPVIEAVVQNKRVAPGKYLLNEGTKINAVIIPSR